MDTYEAVRVCALALLAGAVLQISDVSAGHGLLVDWRTTRCGEELLVGADAFDTAQLFVALVGPEAAEHAAGVSRPAPGPEVHAYMVQPNGGRLRAFYAGPFKVMVEAHEEDAKQAAFAEAMAAYAAHYHARHHEES
jgi:hypothetical protein